MRIARNDWKKHSMDDLLQFGEQPKRLANCLLDLFNNTEYTLVWADDYSDDSREDRLIGSFEIMGKVDSEPSYQRVGYLKLHLDNKVIIERATLQFIEFIRPLSNFYKLIFEDQNG